MRSRFGSPNISSSSRDLHIQDFNFIGVAPWRLVTEMPRHNTIHQSIHDTGISHGLSISYLGLREQETISWINQVLPNSILKPFPVISYRKLKSISDSMRVSNDKRNLIFIYEGSFSWALLIKLLSLKLGNSNQVCNLFPASRYERLMFRDNVLKTRYKTLMWILSKIGGIQLTVDTKHLKNRINSSHGLNIKVEVFPLPSSFDLLVGDKPTSSDHFRILVNIRNFPLSDLIELLNSSCNLCSFVFANGAFVKDKDLFGLLNHSNIKYEFESIPVGEYRNYVDSFDYMIFLYEPSLDSSGKILDCITRKIPMCLPIQAEEWVETAMAWNSTYLFEYGNNQSAKNAFNHPKFRVPLKSEMPSCTPLNTLKLLSSYQLSSTEKNLSTFCLKILVHLHYFLTISIGKLFSLKLKVLRNA